MINQFLVHVFCLAQSCHEATRNKIDENKVAVFGVYFAILAFEVQTIVLCNSLLPYSCQ